MASTQRFEGTNLETLLGEVRSVAGSDVRIVEANRLLRGGIAGFFAKERFEVVIELPDPDATPEQSSAHAVGQMHLLRLADAASDEERRELGEHRRSRELPSVLDAWARDASDADLIPEPEAEDRNPWLADDEPAVTAPPAAAPAAFPTTFDHVLDRIAGISTLTPPSNGAPSRYREDPVVAPPAHPAPPRTTAPPAPDRRRSGLTNQLVGLGLPKRWVDDADLAGEPIDVIARIVSTYAPRPHRLGRDGIIAIVGDATDAFRVAHRLAEELGLYAADIHAAVMGRRPSFLAPSQWLAGPDVVLERRRTWMTHSGITLVVLGAGTGRDGQQWCREMLHVLRPHETWAVVEASRKPEDIEAWAARVGQVDALAVCRADESVSPAAVLAAGIPVTRIDNRPATPMGWGLLLADRLGDRVERIDRPAECHPNRPMANGNGPHAGDEPGGHPTGPRQPQPYPTAQPGLALPGLARVSRPTSAA